MGRSVPLLWLQAKQDNTRLLRSDPPPLALGSRWSRVLVVGGVAPVAAGSVKVTLQ
jgi:hypothetical protein